MPAPYIIGLCLCTCAITVNTCGYAFAPDKYPFNWYETAGWATFGLTFILWGIGRA